MAPGVIVNRKKIFRFPRMKIPQVERDKVFQSDKRSGLFCFRLEHEEMEEQYLTRYLRDEDWALVASYLLTPCAWRTRRSASPRRHPPVPTGRRAR